MVVGFVHSAHNFLNLDSRTNFCLQLIVLYVRCSSFIKSGVYTALHRASLWLRMCRVSIIFRTSCQMNLRSPAWVDSRLFALPVHQPLGIHGLEGVVSAARDCLESNFIPCFLVIAGRVLTLHYETVMSMVDCCPIVLAYSKESGTGVSHAIC